MRTRKMIAGMMFLMGITRLSLISAHADENGLCDIAIRVADETGRPLSRFRIDMPDRFCKDAQGFLHECTAISDADGVAHYVLVRGEVADEAIETVAVRIDQEIINKTQSVEISCLSTNHVLFHDVFRSARGILVFRERLAEEGCGYVLLVHGMKTSPGGRCGYNGGVGTWCNATREFAKIGYGVAEFLYPTGGRIQPAALRLGSVLARAQSQAGIHTWFVLAHSFGGLVVRECMSGNKLCQDRFHGLVTVGTPHLGVGLWCSFFACTPRAQLYEGSWYVRALNARPLTDTPTLVIGGTKRSSSACTSDDVESDGIVKMTSATPPAFSLAYQTEHVSLDHSELACVGDESHSALRFAIDAFADMGGCSFPCVGKETACGIGAFPCCIDGIDNDCDGRADHFDIDCLDIDPGEF